MLNKNKKEGCNKTNCLVCRSLSTIFSLVHYKRKLTFHLKPRLEMCRKISLKLSQFFPYKNDKRLFAVFVLSQYLALNDCVLQSDFEFVALQFVQLLILFEIKIR